MRTKTPSHMALPLLRLTIPLMLSVFLAQATRAADGLLPWTNSLPTPLDSWSFEDTSNWTDDYGDAPISFTNIAWDHLGNGSSLVMETNVPGWLSYEIYQTNIDWTNFIADGPGSVTLWFGPGWATTNGGPGQWAQLIDVGEWTSNSSVGYFGLSIDPLGSNIVFLAQDGSGDSYGLSAPISWTTNFFHFIALTYSSTNVSLYLDGQLTTNDPGGLSIWLPENVISNGLYFGSDLNGNYLANGLFDAIESYGYPLDSNVVDLLYEEQLNVFEISPWNIPYMDLSSAPSGPSTNSTSPDVITGAGYLQPDGTAAGCSYSTNAYFVWITNFVATASSNGLMNVTFSIDGGQSNYLYDVFAIGALTDPISSGTWTWMGQGAACDTYTIPGVNATDCFLILGTPWDSSGSDLTDAYQYLVSKTNPKIQDSDVDGLITGWDVLLGLNPLQSNIGNSAESLDYSYTAADWIYGVSGIKPASNVSMDNEGNVTQVSQ